MEKGIAGELKLLRAYTLVSAATMGFLAVSAFRGSAPTRFEEISVKRINIVEDDGRIRLVISNRAKSPPPMIRGKAFSSSPAGRRPGLIFYNDEETENGGLISGGRRGADGKFSAEHSLTFDQFDQDQVMALQYIDANGTKRTGLQIIDRTNRSIAEQDTAWVKIQSIAEGPPSPLRDSVIQKFRAEFLTAQRVYVGRDRSKTATLMLGDGNGRTRLRLAVDSAGSARIEFLDETGKVMLRIPEQR